MPPRSLEIFDLPIIHRYRDEALVLDSKRALTRGNPLGAATFLAHLDPTQRIYTGITDNEASDPLLGCIIQGESESFAHLIYLAPASQLEAHADLPALIEHLSAQCGNWGAHHVVAEIDERDVLFQTLRRSGFAIYTRQRIWDLSKIEISANSENRWRKKGDVDLSAIQNLQRQIVPPMLQQIEVFAKKSTGQICQADELLAYVDVTYGARGIFLRPLIHPNTDDVGEKMVNLLENLAIRRGRPVYLCVRTHQAWLETILEEMGASRGPRQAVMVKHLVGVIREEKTVPRNADTAWANPAATISKTTTKQSNG